MLTCVRAVAALTASGPFQAPCRGQRSVHGSGVCQGGKHSPLG